MERNNLTLEERIKNVERALFSFFFLVSSYLSLSNPDGMPSYYGNYGILLFIIIFLVSFIFTTMYIINVGVSVMIDATHSSLSFIVNNKNTIAKTLVALLIPISIFILVGLGQDLKDIAVGLIFIIIGSIVPKLKQIHKWILDMLSKIDI